MFVIQFYKIVPDFFFTILQQVETFERIEGLIDNYETILREYLPQSEAPTRPNTPNEVEEAGKMGKAISYKTYTNFANKYKIKLKRNGVLKSMKELSDEIYNHEANNNKIKKGLYFY